MEVDRRKLFIGGISWDTDEERLKEYFSQFGEVVEAMIMRDRMTGRARGFGFVVFADPAVAGRVIANKHIIDGRTVEAKKAVPKDDQHISNRNTSSIHGSPGPGRTRKIFVGGLPPTITQSEFKQYFDQYGTITDVVVMYDHNTQRPRGFGFITYDSEDAVDRVLHKTFHELNGKRVEVKRAVPKEISPSPSRSPLVGYNYGLDRANGFLSNFAQGYSSGSVEGFNVRMDGRFDPFAVGRSVFSPFNTPSYRIGMNLDPGLSPSYSRTSDLGSGLGYGRMLSPYVSGNLSGYNSPIGYAEASGRSDTALTPTAGNVWGNSSLNNVRCPSNPAGYIGSGSGRYGGSVNEANWGLSISSQSAGNASNFTGGDIGYKIGDTNYRLGGESYERYPAANGGPQTSSLPVSSGNSREAYDDLYHSGSVYGDSTWSSSAPEFQGSGLFGYGLRNMVSDVATNRTEGYMGNYDVTSRQSNGGVAA